MGARTMSAAVAVAAMAGLGLAASPDASWLSRVQSAIATEEYRVTWQPEGYQAPNRAHGFRTRFEFDGVRAVPRELAEGETSWEWGLALRGVGRAGAVRPVGRPTLRVADNRVEYERDAIREWWVNDARGLEQGFTLSAPPPGPRGEVVLELQLSGTLSAFPTADGQAIDFRTAQGVNVLRYAELHVNDAGGRVLEARMDARVVGADRVVRIVFDDDGAHYPLTVDPLTTSPGWETTGDQAFGVTGIAVATAGDVNGDGYSDVMVAASSYDNGQVDEGKVWLYAGSASGLSSFSLWTIEGNRAAAATGFSLGSAGDVDGDGYDDVIIGSHGFNLTLTDEGIASVFHGSPTGPSIGADWFVVGGQTGAHFGYSVARAGDVNGDGYDDVIVGSVGYDNGQTDEGLAFIYLGSDDGLSNTPNYFAEANQAGAGLGSSVAGAGDVNADGYDDIVVGEPYWSGTDAGAAVVFYGSAAGITGAGWALNGIVAGAHMGNSVAGAGDVNGDGYADVIVGANRHSGGQSQEGLVSVFHGAATGISPAAAWGIESNQAGAELGTSVATAGDVNGDGYADVIVGGPFVDHGETDEGRAYVYLGSASGLSGVASWVRDGNQSGAAYGRCVATAGDVNGDGYSDFIVGAWLYDYLGVVDAGGAWLYFGSGDGLATVAGWQQSGSAGEDFGISIASAGDVNGDGYSDVLVGAPKYNNLTANDVGRVALHLGSSSGPSATPDWTAVGSTINGYFGHSVAAAGDVNGDGYGDVIVGAPAIGIGSIGRAFIYLGSASGLSAVPSAQVQKTGAEFGDSVAGAGDVNGDGYGDVIVGALKASGERGSADLYLGSASGLVTNAAWTVMGTQLSERLGTTVAPVGDVNGDGFSDVAVAAPFHDTALADAGALFVYHGSSSGLGASPVWTRFGEQANQRFGDSVSAAGDVNGDGYADLLVGSPNRDTVVTDPGAGFVHFGSPSGLGAAAGWIVEGSQQAMGLGGAASTAGDVNGDGYDDVLLGARTFDLVGASSAGIALVYLGSAAGPATDPAWSVTGTSESQLVGSAVAPAGDVDGDGFADILMGELGALTSGTVSLFHGGLDGATERVARQVRAGGTLPIALHGKSDAETGFGLTARAGTPAGRAKLALEWEVKPLGVVLDGTGVGRTTFVDDATEFNVEVTGLSEATFYAWRTRIATNNPHFPRSRWTSIPGNGIAEAKLRTAGCVDIDGDGYGAHGDPSCAGATADCDDASSSWWAVPGPVAGLSFLTKTLVAWDPPAIPGTLGALTYDTLTSSTAGNFTAAACLETLGGDTTTVAPAVGGARAFYLVRGRNACPQGLGSLGTRSSGVPRVGAVCP